MQTAAVTKSELAEVLLRAADGGVAALRWTLTLQPVGGPGDKVFPPTYEGGQYATEQRLLNNRTIDTVLLDSVQSQANRLEQQLLRAFRAGEIQMPVVSLNIGGHGTVTSLDAPHRIVDAIFRDALWEGKTFRKSQPGARIIAARPQNASAMMEYCPTALLFGSWDSHGSDTLGGAKFARCVVSEIVGWDAVPGKRTSSRIDPLGIRAMAGTIFESNDEQWTLVPGEKFYGKKGTPSEIGHGNVTPTISENGGFTISRATQTAVISFAQLRQLSFPGLDGVVPERDRAGRALLAALGLLALTLQWQDGYQLRSRCLLVGEEPPRIELLGLTDKGDQTLQIDRAEVLSAFHACRSRALQAGIAWAEGEIELQPTAKLLELVGKSDGTVSAES